MIGLYVDTGIWVALLDAADPLHSRARAVIEAHRSHAFISNDLVLAETVTLLRRELGPERAAAFGRDFLEGKIGMLAQCVESDWREALTLIERHRDQKISAADATSFAMIRRLDIGKAASFDKHFKIVLAEREVVGAATIP